MSYHYPTLILRLFSPLIRYLVIVILHSAWCHFVKADSCLCSLSSSTFSIHFWMQIWRKANYNHKRWNWSRYLKLFLIKLVRSELIKWKSSWFFLFFKTYINKYRYLNQLSFKEKLFYREFRFNLHTSLAPHFFLVSNLQSKYRFVY